MTQDASVQLKISTVCDEIKNLLLAKNANYGNSALDPVRIFSKASAEEQILVRIDDKLSRIMRGAGLVADDEDVINDLIGYLVLYKVVLQSDNKLNYDEIVKFAVDNYDYDPYEYYFGGTDD